MQLWQIVTGCGFALIYTGVAVALGMWLARVNGEARKMRDGSWGDWR